MTGRRQRGRRRTNSGGGDSTGSAEDHVQHRADCRVLPEREEVEEAGRDAHEDVADVDRRREEQKETEQGPADDARQPSRDEPSSDRAVLEAAGRHVADDQGREGEHDAPEREDVRDDVPIRERVDDADEAEIDEDDAGISPSTAVLRISEDRGISAVLRLPEDAVRPEDQDQDEHAERDDVPQLIW